MDSLAGDLIEQMDRDLLLNHNRLKYELRVLTFIKDISGRFNVKFKMWTKNGICTSIFTQRYLSTLAVKAIHLNKCLETIYNVKAYFENDNRPENDLIR